MPALTPAALRTQIAERETAPLYALVGEDDVEKSAVAGEFANMVDEDLHAFNVDRLHGGEMKVADLVDATATLPMMAPRRIVVVLHAEQLLIPKRESKAADAEQERLETFLKAPPSHATTVFVCGAVDQRRRAVKLLMKEAHVVDCGTIGNERDAARWVKARAGALGVSLETAAVTALVQRAGLDIVRLTRGAREARALRGGTADHCRRRCAAGRPCWSGGTGGLRYRQRD